MKIPPRTKVRYSRVFLLSLFGMRSVADAGIMDPAMGIQTYRDFAENRGIFAAGATNVPIHKLDGSLVGTVPVMPDMDSTVDGGWSALAGGPTFIATVAHNNATTVSFTSRFGGGGAPFSDSYSFVNYNRMPNGYDFAAPRLNKMVTEVEAPEYFLLGNYNGPQTTYNAAAGALYAVRAGGGTQTYATGSGTETTLSGAYAFLTGGTIKFTNNYQGATAPDGYGYIYYNAAVSANLPLNIGIRSGDSGSPSWLYNPTTSRYEYIGAGQSGGGSGFGALNQMRGGNEWAVANILAYNATIGDSGGGAISWNADASGTGTFVQGGNVVGNYIGLPNTVRGATTTVAADGTTTAAASDSQMDATRNLVFNGTGGTITLANPLDIGAGSMTFNASYTLAGARLNSAGMDVAAGQTVTSQLTGISGDDWRKIGSGKLVIAGSGNNLAKLNTGGGGVTELNRTGGQAVSSVKINGDKQTTVRLVGDNQIAGGNGSATTVTFGHRGGRLDLFGHDTSWSGITHLDREANIANTKDADSSTFTFTGTGAQTYLGRFTDDGSAAAGQIDVVYQGGAGSVWSLAGDIANSGSWTISSGEVQVVGTNTLHAGGYVDPSDWQAAGFSTGLVTVAGGARFTAGHHAGVTSNVTVNGSGTMAMSGVASTFTGNVLLNAATARFLADTPASTTATVPGALTGTGYLQKDGQGTLRLLNPNNSLNSGNQLTLGTVSANGLAALGTGTASWTIGDAGVISADNATAAAVKALVAGGSTGTLALAGTGGNPDNTPDMSGAGNVNLFLGALGDVAVGTDPMTTTNLGEWAGGGWKLGGGGGTLTVNLRLAGSGLLTIGNGYNTGAVVLTNIGNVATFTGTIAVNRGVDLLYTDVRALGGGTLDVGYGSSVTTLTGSGSALLARINDPSEGVIAVEDGAINSSGFNFAAEGLDKIYLGSEGTGIYSGVLSPGANGYRFGGSGALTVTSMLSGNIPVTIDGHNKSGGVITLAGANAFTGTLTVRGFDGSLVPSGGVGSITLAAGSTTSFGTSAPVVLQDGGILDLNGQAVTVGSITGTAGSAVTNGSASAPGSLTIQQSTDGTLASILSSPGGYNLNLVKHGAGVLTLSGANTHTGVHTVANGVLRLGAVGSLGAAASSVVVQSGGSIDVNGKSPASFAGMSLAGPGSGALAALHNGLASTGCSLGQVILADDASIGGASGTSFTLSNLNPAGHTATLVSGRLNFNDGATIGSGQVVANNGSLIYFSGSPTGAAGTITLNTGSTLDVRDLSNTGDAKTIVLNGGRIGNGYTHNGGGAQATLYNPIQVTGTGTLDGNNGGWNYRLQFAGPLAGSGALTIASSRGVRFMGDTSGYTGTATVTSTSGVAFNGTNDQVFNGVIAGTRTLYKEGGKALTLGATNTFTGGTEVLGGTLRVNALSGLGTYSAAGGGYLAVKNGATFVYAGTGTETTSRRMWLDTGAAVMDITSPTAVLNWTPNGGGIGGASGGLITKTGAGALFLNGAITGAASLAIDDGTLGLQGTNSHTGGTSANGGTLVLDYALNNTTKLADAGGLVFGGGTVTLTGGSHLEVVGSTTLAIGTTSKLNRTSGTAVLAMGNITSEAGAILAIAQPSIATTTTTLVNDLLPGVLVGGALATRDGGNFVVPFTGFSDVTRLSSGTKVIANDATRNVRIIEGSGTLADIVVAAAATDANSLTNTSTGGLATVRLDGNVLRLAAVGQVVADTASQGLAITNGTLTAGGAEGVAGGVIISNNSAAATIINAAIADNGAGVVALAKLGAGGLTLAGANTYSGDTVIHEGIVALGAANGVPDGAGKGNLNIAAGAGFDLGGFSETINGLGGGGVVDNSSSTQATFTVGANNAAGTFSGILRNTGAALSLAKSGSGTLTLEGSNTYTGTTTINGGTLVAIGGGAIPDTSAVSLANVSGASLVLGASESIGSLSGGGSTGGTINLQANTLVINQSATTTYGAAISGTGGSLVKNGTGTLTLSAVSGYNGSLNIQNGTLVATAGTSGDASALGSGTTAITVGDGATLRFATNNRTCGIHSGPATITGGTITFNTSDNSFAAGKVLAFDTKAGTINGSGQWRMRTDGAGVAVAAAASGSTISVSTLTLTGAITGGYVFDVADGALANDLTISAAIGSHFGGEAIVKAGTGTMAITRQATFTGATTIQAGTLVLGVANASGGTLAGTPSITVPTGATLDLSAQDAIGWTGGKQAIVINGGTVTQSVTGVRSTVANTITMTGGTLSATGAGDASGNYSFFNGAGITATSGAAGTAAMVNAPVIAIQTNGNFPVTVTRGAATPASDLTISSVIRDNMSSSVGTLVKSGNGILTLAGANTYRGQTTINQGEVVLTGSLASTAATTVASGATLRGTGGIAGPTTITGTLAPGVSGIGALTVNNTLTLNGSLVMDIHKSGATRSADQLLGTGTLACGGALVVTATGDTLAAGDVFTLFVRSSYSGSFSAIQLPVLTAGLVWDDSQLKVNGTITVITHLQAWRKANFGSTADAGNSANAADPDGDGIANLMEYALGLNPNVSAGMAGKIVVDEATGHLRLSATRDPSAVGITLIVEVSGNMVDWDFAEGIDIVTEVDTPSLLVVRDLTGDGTADRRFIRIRVVADPG